MLKPESEMSASDLALCNQITYAIDQLWNVLPILVGNPHLDDGPDGEHEGLLLVNSGTMGTHVHIDRNVFQAAEQSQHGHKLLVALLLHEFAHLSGPNIRHPSGHVGGIYSDEPFNRLSPNSQHACIAF